VCAAKKPAAAAPPRSEDVNNTRRAAALGTVALFATLLTAHHLYHAGDATAATDNTFVFASPEATEGIQRRTESMRFGDKGGVSKSATAADDAAAVIKAASAAAAAKLKN
jgi:hypothetical protein